LNIDIEKEAPGAESDAHEDLPQIETTTQNKPRLATKSSPKRRLIGLTEGAQISIALSPCVSDAEAERSGLRFIYSLRRRQADGEELVRRLFGTGGEDL
jgi:hypothetical protein